jgi:aspartyl aminopeptidase
MAGAHTDDLIEFVAASPSPFHAVATAVKRLEKAGFRRVDEREAWTASSGGHYLTRGGTLIAWYLPEDALADPARPFHVVGSHTDSPTLRVKPRPDTGSAGWRQVAVEIYGGPLLNSWLDRDLGLAGRLVLRDGEVSLVETGALLRVPQLAIHLNQGANESLTLDPQQHLTPVWGVGPVRDGDLIEHVAAVAGVPPSAVAGWDLMTYETTPPAYLGRDRELFAAPRLDNQLSVHATLTALLAAVEQGPPEGASIPVLAAFDHEETGSESDTGARGPVLGNALERLVAARGGTLDDRMRAFAGTVLLSSDVGHAVHPNYPERHEPGHHPVVNGGPILKTNVNNRYATDGRGRAIWTAACERAGVPWQHFVGHNAMRCGTTIGPIAAARLGITTVDVGVPLLSMHSSRELGGTRDPELLSRAFRGFYAG